MITDFAHLKKKNAPSPERRKRGQRPLSRPSGDRADGRTGINAKNKNVVTLTSNDIPQTFSNHEKQLKML